MSKITPKNVKLKDWITVGVNNAVVYHINEKESNKIKVVYLDGKNRAINEDVIYKDGEWTFVYDGPNGGYADNYSRLGEFVSILRAGRWR